MKFWRIAGLTALLAGWPLPGPAQDVNIPVPVDEIERQLATEPFAVAAAEISRPKAKGDITLKAEVSFDGKPPYRLKLRRADPGGDGFNNRPRYDVAAYELQKLFLDPAEYVVPPTAVRMMPVAGLQGYPVDVKPTFRGSDDVMVVLQYWLHDVTVVADVLDQARFASDAGYARHIGQLNVFTFLIEHGDANVGNFLISTAERAPRVFSVDNGVAFAYNESDRSDVWKNLRVDRLPADAVERLRAITRDDLRRRLEVLAQWRLQDGRWVAEPPGENLSQMQGLRRKGDLLQLGLRKGEIDRLAKRVEELLKQVDSGKVQLLVEDR
jgi:hypothetical protein